MKLYTDSISSFDILEQEFDVFVCYDETMAKDYAETILNALSRRKYKVFVAHVQRVLMEGDYRTENINPIIQKSKIFILINGKDALQREEIIHEVKVAFPEGDRTGHLFWIVKEKNSDIPFGDKDFNGKTKINLQSINQNEFETTSELARLITRKCENYKRQIDEKEIPQPSLVKPVVLKMSFGVSNKSM